MLKLNVFHKSDFSCSDPDAIVAETDSGEIHLFTGESSPEREIVVHRHYPGKLSGRASVVSTRVRSQKTTFSSSGIDCLSNNFCENAKSRLERVLLCLGNSTNRSTFYQPSLDFGKPPEGLTSLGPEPILKLDRLLGFGCGWNNHVTSYQ